MCEKKLRIALISMHYPPMRTSAAVQIRDLAQEMLRQGHEPLVIVPSGTRSVPWVVEIIDRVKILRLHGTQTQQTNYLKRTISELLLPFMMIHGLYKSPFLKTSWDLVVWYSPTIFFGPLIWFLKRSSRCSTYLILRDIFPEWTLDFGLMGKGLIYWFFKGVASLQYSLADTIGVQTPSNLCYVSRWKNAKRELEVLQNWQTPALDMGSSIQVRNTSLSGRKIFVYIGNMGIAQGMDIFIDLADQLKYQSHLGFLFVGRGSEISRLKTSIAELSLQNVLFFDEVDSKEMPGLLSQCHVGLLALDPRHKTHNIPGKFITYLLAGLPVLARVNTDNDIAQLIEKEGVGRVYVGDSVKVLSTLAEAIIGNSTEYENMKSRGPVLAGRMFSPAAAVNQITATAYSKID
jgi:glycosyltransferase involved in cell wall biosynthesis